MGTSAMKHKSKKWYRWRKSSRSSRRETTLTVHLQDIIYKNTSREDDEAKDLRMLDVGAAKLSTISQEDVAAAIVIQVHFRRHLDREFSGPYTERDSESLDDEVAPRRRRPGKEPMVDGRQRPQSTQGANPQEVQERIRAHEAEIQRLRRDLEAHQATRP
ncbi:hypothetical protein AgCh_026787 [Apium graveolens]